MKISELPDTKSDLRNPLVYNATSGSGGLEFRKRHTAPSLYRNAIIAMEIDATLRLLSQSLKCPIKTVGRVYLT